MTLKKAKNPRVKALPPNGEAIKVNRKPDIEVPRGKRRPNRHQRRALIKLLKCYDVFVDNLKPLGRETRQHPRSQIKHLVKMIEAYGIVVPIIIDDQSRVVNGQAVVLAAKELGIRSIPAVCISHLSDTQLRALRIALNKIVELSSWNESELSIEIKELYHLDESMPLGIETPTLELIVDGAGLNDEDEGPPIAEPAESICKLGDQYKCGDHVILCGDALKADAYRKLLGTTLADMVFTDPPYNVPILGNVTRSTHVGHDFPMATGELSSQGFEQFLKTSLGHVAAYPRKGAIIYVCIDWRHLDELLAAGKAVFSKLLNLCVWHKSNAGMGSLYRSQHELVLVFKLGTKPHVNNVLLGKHGRNRTNVWTYVSQSALSATSKSKLAMHPTVKPVAMIADAIRDCSNRGDIILDPFGGAGTTMIAAEKTGRRARLLELNPTYVDVTIRRWEKLTGGTAYHTESGEPYGQHVDKISRRA